MPQLVPLITPSDWLTTVPLAAKNIPAPSTLWMVPPDALVSPGSPQRDANAVVGVDTAAGLIGQRSSGGQPDSDRAAAICADNAAELVDDRPPGLQIDTNRCKVTRADRPGVDHRGRRIRRIHGLTSAQGLIRYLNQTPRLVGNHTAREECDTLELSNDAAGIRQGQRATAVNSPRRR